MYTHYGNLQFKFVNTNPVKERQAGGQLTADFKMLRMPVSESEHQRKQ